MSIHHIGQWILGDNAVPKLEKLHLAYVKNRLQIARNHFKDESLEYHPALGNLTCLKMLTTEDLNKLAEAKRYIDFNIDIQTIRKRIYQHLFTYNKINSFAIIEDVYSIAPSANAEFLSAIKAIEFSCGWMYRLFSKIIYEVCFVLDKGDIRGEIGASDYNLIGTIFTCLKPKPNCIFELGVALAHELGHNAFFIYQAGQDPVAAESRAKWIYSGVRKVKRPAFGAFHGVIALAYMICFCDGFSKSISSSSSEKDVASRRKSELLTDLGEGLNALKELELSPIGVRIFNEVSNYYANSLHEIR